MNNAPFERRGDGVFVEPPTGIFLRELVSLVPEVVAVQATVAYSEQATQNSFDVASCPGLGVATMAWREGTALERMLSYARAVPWALLQVWRARALYIFLPGHLPLLFVMAAHLLRRPYGVYLRGEFAEPGLGRALGPALFANAVNERMLRDAARHCRQTRLVAPMMELQLSDIVHGRPQRTAGPWRLLFVGRVERLKGIGELLEAVAQLRAAGIPVELDVVGWSLEFEQHRGEAQRLGLAAVRFHGVVMDRDRLRKLYEEADLFVLPTHSDGFPRVLYEAMACGVPILTTFVGGIPAVMRDRVNCLEVPLRDASGLAARIEAAIADPELRSLVAEGGIRTVSEVLGAGRPTHAQSLAGQLAEIAT